MTLNNFLKNSEGLDNFIISAESVKSEILNFAEISNIKEELGNCEITAHFWIDNNSIVTLLNLEDVEADELIDFLK